MTRPTLYIAITNHGFGHAVRAASVAGAIQRLNPEILLVLVTTAPHWLLYSYIHGDFIQRVRGLDVGVIQVDSLTMDREATLAKLREIQDSQHRIIAGEVDFIRTNGVGLVLADVPPLAAPIAKMAGVPCWMMSNFGWDYIYRDWGGEFNRIADWMRDCYSQCDRLFRLPFHETMSAFSQITDVGLTGGTTRYTPETIRQIFHLVQPRDRTILLSFGGLGLQTIPYPKLQDFPDWQFITFDANAPDWDNIVKVTDNQYRPVDFMPLCGRVVSKPGYSTFSEALCVGTPIATITRTGFAESQLLMEGLQQYAFHQIIDSDAFFQGTWEFLRQPLIPPKSSTPLPTNGTETIAQNVVDYLG
ncbi:glycosyl transferase [Spirulina subsalsa FACHB-351]|uniref:Glycosyl transferase n=1 Tax=Spirulina subsalsa FACHB-351 TaxID=234711 RepID=A0ABT3KZX1_9CYAN|nr:glycosyl transferase [Spirulina subsalsa]MCW6034785.1 glycosyl transferase [Spirulina subsalsa FACHB-351]